MVFYMHMAALIFAAVLGGCLGSFLNVVVWRLPAGMSLVRPGSFCPKCGHPIRFRDNIPVFGWLFLGGRCRDCRAPISFRYPLIEFICALIAVFFATVFFILERGIKFGLLAWGGLGDGMAAIERYAQGQDLFQAATPESVLCTGLGMVFLWSCLLYIFLGIALVEWDGRRMPQWVLLVQAAVSVATLGSGGFHPVLAACLLTPVVSVLTRKRKSGECCTNDTDQQSGNRSKGGRPCAGIGRWLPCFLFFLCYSCALVWKLIA